MVKFMSEMRRHFQICMHILSAHSPLPKCAIYNIIMTHGAVSLVITSDVGEIIPALNAQVALP